MNEVKKTCECGRVAVRKKDGSFICARCDQIESRNLMKKATITNAIPACLDLSDFGILRMKMYE